MAGEEFRLTRSVWVRDFEQKYGPTLLDVGLIGELAKQETLLPGDKAFWVNPNGPRKLDFNVKLLTTYYDPRKREPSELAADACVGVPFAPDTPCREIYIVPADALAMVS